MTFSMPSDNISDGRNDARRLDDARVAEWRGEDGRRRIGGGRKAYAENDDDDGADDGRNSAVVVVRTTACRNAMRMRVAIVDFVGDQA
jgi:hypothetical protein